MGNKFAFFFDLFIKLWIYAIKWALAFSLMPFVFIALFFAGEKGYISNIKALIDLFPDDDSKSRIEKLQQEKEDLIKELHSYARKQNPHYGWNRKY